MKGVKFDSCHCWYFFSIIMFRLWTAFVRWWIQGKIQARSIYFLIIFSTFLCFNIFCFCVLWWHMFVYTYYLQSTSSLFLLIYPIPTQWLKSYFRPSNYLGFSNLKIYLLKKMLFSHFKVLSEVKNDSNDKFYIVVHM